MTEELAVHSSVSAPEPPLSSVGEALTFRAVLCAIVFGSAVCFANTYFGLQAGTVNAMPMQTSLLGFALFRSIQHRISKSLSPEETTVIEIIAGALGLAPFTSGFTGPIPALEFLTTPFENGPKRFSAAQLIMWSIATCALGTVIAVPFRRLFILRECLRYPSATATGTLIGVLFGKEKIVARAQQPESAGGPLPESQPLGADTDSDLPEAASQDRTDPGVSDHLNTDSPHEIGYAVNVLLVSLSGSALFSLISYFLPILKNMPVFGRTLAKDWLWAFNLSPAYLGYGIIIGPSVNFCTLLGAIVGWGILSPMAKYNGWAVGPVDDWDNGSRGWILWVGIGLILGDSAVGLVWVISKPLMSWVQRWFRLRRLERLGSQVLGEQEGLLQDSLVINHKDNTADSAVDDDWPATSRVTLSLMLWTGVILLLLYFVSLLSVFQGFVSPFATLIAVILVPFGGFISMRSLGETDNGASLAIGRAAQCIIGLLVPASNSNHIFANLLLGCVVEAGASQASQQMGGLKTAYMTRTAPRAIFYSQIIGSFAGTLIATLVYKIYTSVKEIPNEEFGIPEAHMWLVAARLIYQQGLPVRALDFAIGAFLIGAVFSILRILGSNHWWRCLVPSGVAVAIGMYLIPAITLPRALGSVILIIGHNRLGIENFVLMCSATGLILGQGVFGLVALAFDALHVPHL